MKKIVLLIITGIACVSIIIFLLLNFSILNFNTTLEVTVRDAVSKSWVYDSTIKFQNRVIRGFKSTLYTFNNLKTGSSLLSVSAPYYESKEIMVSIHGGKNQINDPIELRGHTIPGLDSISIFEKKKDNTIFIDIRMVGEDGHAISNHPCLPIRILTRISVQIVDEEYDKYTEGKNLKQGKLLYSGEARWVWNTGLTETYKYSAYIPLEDISGYSAPYWIIGYLILIPDPLQISREQVNEIVREILAINDQGTLNIYLNGIPDAIDYYLTIKPNIENLLGGDR